MGQKPQGRCRVSVLSSSLGVRYHFAKEGGQRRSGCGGKEDPTSTLAQFARPAGVPTGEQGGDGGLSPKESPGGRVDRCAPPVCGMHLALWEDSE